MTLSHRERVLLGAVAVLGVAVAGWLLFGVFSGPLRTRRDELANLTGKLRQKQDEVLAAQKARDRLAQWNRQSLPSEVARAGSLYQNWLLELAGKAGFRNKKVEPGEARARGDSYTQLPFTVRGQATLDELVRFLFDFYSTGYLHQIRRITVKPTEKRKDLELVVLIEALSLPTADRKDQLSQEHSNRLALGSLDDYRKAIGARNILAPYQPPMPMPMPMPTKWEDKGPPFDPSKYAFVTAIVQVNGTPQVWVKARTTDEKFQLHQGDKLQIGPFRATIARINPRDVEIEIDGKRHTIPLGGSVREGEKKPADGARGSEGPERKPADSAGPKTGFGERKAEEAEADEEHPSPKPTGKRMRWKPDLKVPKAEGKGPKPESKATKPESKATKPESKATKPESKD
jgi:hypothetical protein